MESPSPDQQFRREVAQITNIKDIIEGEYFKEEGWIPNYILTKRGKKVSRVNIIGAIIPGSETTYPNYMSVDMDDGSAKISVREFEGKKTLSALRPGDVILLIGRPRQFGQEKYILPEITKKIKNLEWLEVRKKALQLADSRQEPNKGENEMAEEMPLVEEEGVFSDMESEVLKIIEDNDGGEGTKIEIVLNASNKKNPEAIISDLLKKGEIFEVTPGKVKVLH